MFISLLQQNPLLFMLVFISLIISLGFHEFAHAFIADKLGDPTSRYLGRLTLNPIRHLDPIGTLMLFFVGFGWGRPVPFNPANLSNPKRDAALISISGPLSNMLLAVIASIFFRILPLPMLFETALYYTIVLNVNLAVFNLLPFHPLDGYKVVSGLLPLNLYYQWLEMEKYGTFILLFLVVTGYIGIVLTPIVSILLKILVLS